MVTIAELLHSLEERQDSLQSMLATLKWPLPGQLGAAWLDLVADSYHAGSLAEQDVADVLLDKYRKHGLEDLRREWSEDNGVAARLPILLDVLKAHADGQYTLSVPVVLAQIEGLIASAKAHRGRFSGKHLRQYVEPIRECGTRFQKIAARMLVEELWSEFNHGDSLPRLSRHAILHGADVGYATADNSLRAILYFDNIRNALATLAIYATDHP